ncbi:nuclear transport factor 2 family protein [Bradyrhizobium zhanjiangense]|uniref:Nuclear transport factor 2 family protein n=1 Tax=Bradyrhizobium zhanjiangense TaxID=1325107 RepID=A0ABY0D918_9BRAD|nr:nuclear transport factor 2 family protein [Bradyrhizobium zhanjiangense]RXG85302.1 nuclear transport factor 2 family protein [Bradyrhizobium zhanjiangense]
MNDLERLLIEQRCTRLFYDYANFGDFDDPVKAVRLFTDDASLILKNRGKTFSGRKEFEALFQNQKEGQLSRKMLQRHVLSQIMIDVKDSDHATGQARVTLYRAEWDLAQGPCPYVYPVIFQWNDEFVRTSEGWKIFTHTVSQFAFQAPEARFSSPSGR